MSATAFSTSCLSRNNSALGHGHFLEGLEREVFLRRVGGKKFLDDDHLVMHLAEADEKITVRGGGVNLVAEFVQRGLGGVQPFRRGKGDQRRFVLAADEVKGGVHLIFSTGGAAAWAAAWAFIRSVLAESLNSPRDFLMLSMPRETTLRLVQ